MSMTFGDIEETILEQVHIKQFKDRILIQKETVQSMRFTKEKYA